MASDRYNIEALIKAWIETSDVFDGIAVEHYDSTQDTVPNKNRVFVQCGEPEPLAGPINNSGAVKVWKAACSIVMLVGGRNPETLDSWEAEIGSLFSSAAPSSVQTLAETLFPNGIEAGPVNSGSRQGEGNRVYRCAKTLEMIFCP